MHLFSIRTDTTFSRLRNKIKSILPRLKCAIQQIYEDTACFGGSATAIHPLGNVEARRLAIFTIQSDDDLAQAIAYVRPLCCVCRVPLLRVRRAACAVADLVCAPQASDGGTRHFWRRAGDAAATRASRRSGASATIRASLDVLDLFAFFGRLFGVGGRIDFVDVFVDQSLHLAPLHLRVLLRFPPHHLRTPALPKQRASQSATVPSSQSMNTHLFIFCSVAHHQQGGSFAFSQECGWFGHMNI